MCSPVPGAAGREVSVACGRPHAFHFILEAQFEALEFGNMPIIDGGGCKRVMELLFEGSMLLLQRFKMSLYGHLMRPSLSPTSSPHPLEFQALQR
jgi:hypothetical protein